MALMSRDTGGDIADTAHLVQSIQDILTTLVGTRVAVRDYGCWLPILVDKTVNRQWVIDAFYYIAVALDRWEPRYVLSSIRLDASRLSEGIIACTLSGVYKPLGKVIVLENVTLNFGVPSNG